jgi:glycosyltransferase involved in cell wall biosynthesis
VARTLPQQAQLAVSVMGCVNVSSLARRTTMMSQSAKKVLLIGVEPLSLLNFRGHLITSIKQAGHEVLAVSAEASVELQQKLSDANIKHASIPFQRNGLNPIADLKTCWALYCLFRQHKPDVVLSYTIKPVIWGGLAARLAGVPFYALVTGLGFAFQGASLKRRLLTHLVSALYRFSLSRATKVVFQNKDNAQVFIGRSIVPIGKTEVVNGSGVDISRFAYQAPPTLHDHEMVFLCVARLLGEKGLREFAQASKMVRSRYPNIRCQILGWQDPSPDGISITEVESWQQEGIIDYLGVADDVRPLIALAHVYVLPSYHEGLPRSTVEAMAMGKPIITTTAVGCRETVEDGVNGYKVPVADAAALADKMIWFLEHPEAIEPMGLASRKMAEDKFDVQKVTASLLNIMDLS